MNDLKDMQGFDPNGSLQIDQSIMQDSDAGTPRDSPLDKFSDNLSMDGGYRRNGSISSTRSDKEGYEDLKKGDLGDTGMGHWW